MSRYYRAIAVDYDGTLTDSDTPHPAVLAAIHRVRGAGRLVVLVTGRILGSLLACFPDAERTFDGIVAENGAVIRLPGRRGRTVAPPVDPALAAALESRGVPFERGEVLLATLAVHDRVVLEEIARLGLEVQLVRNRGALMALPSGVTKGTGLLEALADLGISKHSTVAVGDAENDHSLLESCELGVAVANAVPSLQNHADVVLAEPAGRGVLALLGGRLLRGEIRVQPKRWQVRLGTADDGTAVTIPGSQVNLVITGGSESGKSHLAGLLAERLIAMGYSVGLIDPEGDHIGLQSQHGVVVVGGTASTPAPDQLAALLRVGSVVVDLSLRTPAERVGECRRTLAALAEHRATHGTPHWIIVDEAHLVPDLSRVLSLGPGSTAGGMCAVTWRPDQLSPDTLAAMDLALVLSGSGPETTRCLGQAGFATPLPMLRHHPPGAGRVDGRLLDRGSARRFVADLRNSAHRRHWHKYLSADLPYHRRFFFRLKDRLTGAVAASMTDFHHEIVRADAQVLRHHARSHDFSRWTEEVLRDRPLAERMRAVEDRLAGSDAAAEEGRWRLLEEIETHYEDRGA